MEEKILKAIGDFSLLKRGQSVTVALSGGADSMALLFALNKLKDTLGIELYAAHFNHKIRGEEAEADQRFVSEYCKKMNINLFVGSCDIPRLAHEKGLSVELAAREERYAFLDNVGKDAIATAHTLSDNLETIIFNLTRGTALKGLCGIPVKRERYIRPLIYCSRADIENYCVQNEIPFVTDSTNLCDDYTRNKIRHNVVPVLKTLNPSVEDAVLRTVDSLVEDNDFIENIAENEFNSLLSEDNRLSVDNFSSMHKAVAKRVIAKYYKKVLGMSPDNFHINGIYEICLKGGRVSIAGNKSALVNKGMLNFVENGFENRPQNRYDVTIAEINLEKIKNVHDLFLNNVIDCDKIVGNVVVRTRLPGDKMYLNKSNGTKTLKKLYTEYAIPVSERTVWPVIADDKGVIWVNGIGVSKRCAFADNTKRVACINVTVDKG